MSTTKPQSATPPPPSGNGSPFLTTLFLLGATWAIIVLESKNVDRLPALATIAVVVAYAVCAWFASADGTKISTAVYGLFFLGGIASVHAALSGEREMSTVIRTAASHFLADLGCGMLGALVCRELFPPANDASAARGLCEGMRQWGEEVRNASVPVFKKLIGEASTACAESLTQLGKSASVHTGELQRMNSQLNATIESTKQWGRSIDELHSVLNEFVEKVLPLVQRLAKEEGAKK